VALRFSIIWRPPIEAPSTWPLARAARSLLSARRCETKRSASTLMADSATVSTVSHTS
jgi:hypothetical protein